MDCRSFILTLLQAYGGTIESATKIQKLAFLSIRENGLEPFTSFKWHYYGPFSEEIQNTVKVLKKQRIVSEKGISRTSYSGKEYTVKRLSLTAKGRRLTEDENFGIATNNERALLGTIEKYGNKPLTAILDYVYKAYGPEDFQEPK
jgi:uncharacterized protein YwgA